MLSTTWCKTFPAGLSLRIKGHKSEGGIVIYSARKNQTIYGQGIGILMLDTRFTPFIPGDIGNASTFNFPVTYKVIEGLTVERATSKDPSVIESLVKGGEALAKGGVRAITSTCGYLGFFQKEMTDRLDVPVFMSSLLQLPFILAMIGKKRKVGILCARGETFDDSLIESVGVDPAAPLVIRGLDTWENFYADIMIDSGKLDAEKVEEDVVAAARQMVEEDGSIGAILLECADLPPYAMAVQKAVGLPVFDFVTMINYVFSVVVRNRFSGFM